MEPTPQIPREDWAAHPNFPAQTLLLGSHENFRILARQVLDLASAHPERAERLFRRWMFAMGSHERYEESKLYPYLSRRWDVSMAPLEAGHEALAERKRAVLDAFERSHEQDRLDRTLRDFGDTLRAHLDLEERTVIPLLLELSPDEFADYYALPIRTLLERMSASRSLS
ncbi:MAG: hemerythrin domain-containing protein [Sandaracinaceae bacterium]